MTFGLVNASFSLPEWQAVKMTFFALWLCTIRLVKLEESLQCTIAVYQAFYVICMEPVLYNTGNYQTIWLCSFE